MAVYRYHVIVDTEITTGGSTKGATEARTQLERIEREARQSQKRRLDDEAKLNQELNRLQQERVRNDQRLASESAQFHQERFRKQIQDSARFYDESSRQHQAAAAREVEATKNKWREILRVDKEARDVQLGARGLIFSPDQIREQTRRQATQQDRLRGFAGREIQTGLENINRIVESDKVREFDRNLNNLLKTTNQSAKSFSLWGQAFKGAFVGAVAGFSFYALTAAIVVPIQLLTQLGVEGVKAAARLETTTNALRVFTGSTRLAKEELAAIDEVARTTAGLRLETAEVGYQQLRALGFEANQARGFIKELAEEKILSGAQDEALQRVIFNFAQIASGGQKVSQEIREIVTQMPTFRRVFEEAFGTTNPQKIQEFLDTKGVDAFIEKVQKAMREGEAATGGLEDAFGKLQDQILANGRQFGEPLLEPLTLSVKDLTKFLIENQDAWIEWGVYVGRIIRGARENIVDEQSQLEKYANSFNNAARRALLGTITLGFSETIPLLLQQLEERGKQAEERDKQTAQGRIGILRSLSGGGLVRTEADKERLAKERNEREDAARVAELARQKELESLESSSKQATTILQARFATEQALLDRNIRYTSEQELTYAKASGDIRKRALEAELAQTTGYYNKLIALGGDGKKKISEIEAEKTAKIVELGEKIKQEELKQLKEVQEAERRILEERRQALIEFKQLQIREIQTRTESDVFDIERQIEHQLIDTEKGFDQLIALTKQSYEQIRQLTVEQFQLRLEDESLSAEQRRNIYFEMYQAEQELAANNRRQILQIEDRKREELLRNYQLTFTRIQDVIAQQTEALQTYFDTAFGLDIVSTRSLAAIDIDIQPAKEKLLGFQNELKKLRDDETEALKKSGGQVTNVVGDIRSQIGNVNKEILSLTRQGLTEFIPVFEQFKEAIKANPNDITVFDQIRQQVFEILEQKQFDALAAEILTLNNKVQQSIGKTREDAQRELDAAIAKRDQFEAGRVGRRTRFEEETLEGIQKRITDLASDPLVQLRERYIEQQNILTEQEATWKEILALTQRLGQDNTYGDNLRIQREDLLHQLEIRERETDAIIRGNAARREIQQQTVFSAVQANSEFLEFLAQQKGVTEIMSDARIGAISAAYSELDRVIGRLTDSMGAFGDVIKDVLSNLIKLFANQFFARMFGGGGGQTQTGGGGGNIFGIPNINLGGGGFQTTPSFNPNQFAISGFSGLNLGGVGDGTIGQPRGVLGDIRGQVDQLLRPGTAGGAAAASAGATGGFGSILSGLAPLLPLLGAGLGAGLGRGSLAGNILGGVSGGILGLTAFGLLAPTAFASVFGTASIGLATALPFLAPVAVAGLIAAHFIGRSQQRRKEEQLRNTAILDAFRQIDELISNVNSDRIDGSQALSQAEQIRAQYVEQMSQLKDSKTRKHALQDVSRIDSKITDLKAAIDRQRSRQEYQGLLVPTFADGGDVSTFIRKNVKHNPLGYQHGGEAMGYFPKANSLALYNERGSEYILDAETTKAIGIEMLDQIRATKGESFNSMRRKISIPSRADGGAVSTVAANQPIASGVGTSQRAGAQTVERTIVNVYLAKETFVEVVKEIISEYNGSDEMMQGIKTNLKNNGAGGDTIGLITSFVNQRNQK